MDRRNLIFVRALCAAAVLGTGGIAQAGSLEPPAGPVAPTMKTLDQVEARKPIHQSDLPLAINVDGSYYLAENLYALQNGVDMIDVFAADVSIDLNGFTINGTSQVAQAADCIQLETSVRSFALHNGVIRGCGQHGVTTNGGANTRISVNRVESSHNGQSGMTFGVGTYGVISESVFKSNGARGVLLGDGVIEDSVAYSNGSIGLQLSTGLIRGCMARSNVSFNTLILQGGLVADTYAP